MRLLSFCQSANIRISDKNDNIAPTHLRKKRVLMNLHSAGPAHSVKPLVTPHPRGYRAMLYRCLVNDQQETEKIELIAIFLGYHYGSTTLTTWRESPVEPVRNRMSESASRSMQPAATEQQCLARQDWNSARFVEEGISIQLVYGTRYAASFLKNRMIGIDVARRVLLTPAQRRNYPAR